MKYGNLHLARWICGTIFWCALGHTLPVMAWTWVKPAPMSNVIRNEHTQDFLLKYGYGLPLYQQVGANYRQVYTAGDVTNWGGVITTNVFVAASYGKSNATIIVSKPLYVATESLNYIGDGYYPSAVQNAKQSGHDFTFFAPFENHSDTIYAKPFGGFQPYRTLAYTLTNNPTLTNIFGSFYTIGQPLPLTPTNLVSEFHLHLLCNSPFFTNVLQHFTYFYSSNLDQLTMQDGFFSSGATIVPVSALPTNAAGQYKQTFLTLPRPVYCQLSNSLCGGDQTLLKPNMIDFAGMYIWVGTNQATALDTNGWAYWSNSVPTTYGAPMPGNPDGVYPGQTNVGYFTKLYFTQQDLGLQTVDMVIYNGVTNRIYVNAPWSWLYYATGNPSPYTTPPPPSPFTASFSELTIDNISQTSTTTTLAGHGGSAGASFAVLSSTSLTASRDAWMGLGTSTFVSNGMFAVSFSTPQPLPILTNIIAIYTGQTNGPSSGGPLDVGGNLMGGTLVGYATNYIYPPVFFSIKVP